MFLFLLSLVAGIGAGLFLGGSLTRLTRFPLRYTWLIIIAFLIQFLLFATPLERQDLPNNLAPGLHLFSSLLLFLVVSANRGYVGVKIVGLGLLLNFLVIAANGGYMPVSLESLQKTGQEESIAVIREVGHVSKSTLMTSETRLNFLGDSLIINLPVIREKVFSIGDAIIAAGGFVLVSQAMIWRPKRWDWS